MRNVLVFQPYLSTRKLSSNTIERQFRFLTKEKSTNVFVLLDKKEKECIDNISSRVLLANLSMNIDDTVKELQKLYNFDEIYIARTYFTPVKQEDIDYLKNENWPLTDFRYHRNYLPIAFSKLGVKVTHVIYDPLELKYDELISNNLYRKVSSMNNVENAKPHLFADYGYYDKNEEIALCDKQYDFTFGATAVDKEREQLLHDIHYNISRISNANIYLRTSLIDTLVSNEIYEDKVSKSLFTYTIPSYDPKHMSFTRMLLALSQGTIPLLHPDNNLDCLFGEGFECRDSLKEFFKSLIMSIKDLRILLTSTDRQKVRFYMSIMNDWHNTDYYKWLQTL